MVKQPPLLLFLSFLLPTTKKKPRYWCRNNPAAILQTTLTCPPYTMQETLQQGKEEKVQKPQLSSVRSAGQENYQGDRCRNSSSNLTITRTRKVYLRKRVERLHLQMSDIPDYILKIHKQYMEDPTAFEASKSRQHFRSCISLLRRYGLAQKKRVLNARRDPAQYMRNYR